MQVTRTLYGCYGLIGGPIQVLALVSCSILTWRMRHRAPYRATLAGTLCLALSLLLWALLVRPASLLARCFSWPGRVRHGSIGCRFLRERTEL